MDAISATHDGNIKMIDVTFVRAHQRKMVERFGVAAALTPAFLIGPCARPLSVFRDPILLGCCMVIIGLSAPSAWREASAWRPHLACGSSFL